MFVIDNVLKDITSFVVDNDIHFSNRQKLEFTASNAAAIGATISSEIVNNNDNISQI